MWLIVDKQKSENRHIIVAGKKYVVGRQACDIVIQDASVSRVQAQLTVYHKEADVLKTHIIPVLNLEDVSKFGSYVNGKIVRKNGSTQVNLKDGDEIKFGGSTFIAKYEPFVVTPSCLEKIPKKELQKVITALGGHLVRDWRDNCELLVMPKINVTIKVVCALNKQKHIVVPDYLQDLLNHYLDNKIPKPDPKNYLPEVVDTEVPPGVSFLPDERRGVLFKDVQFYFLSAMQFNKTNVAVSTAGGQPILLEDGGEIEAKIMAQSDTVVLHVPREIMVTLSPQCQAFVKLVKATLARANLRMITDPEVGWAVLTCNIESFCNPKTELASGTFAAVASQSLGGEASNMLSTSQLSYHDQPDQNDPLRQLLTGGLDTKKVNSELTNTLKPTSTPNLDTKCTNKNSHKDNSLPMEGSHPKQDIMPCSEKDKELIGSTVIAEDTNLSVSSVPQKKEGHTIKSQLAKPSKDKRLLRSKDIAEDTNLSISSVPQERESPRNGSQLAKPSENQLCTFKKDESQKRESPRKKSQLAKRNENQWSSFKKDEPKLINKPDEGAVFDTESIDLLSTNVSGVSKTNRNISEVEDSDEENNRISVFASINKRGKSRPGQDSEDDSQAVCLTKKRKAMSMFDDEDEDDNVLMPSKRSSRSERKKKSQLFDHDHDEDDDSLIQSKKYSKTQEKKNPVCFDNDNDGGEGEGSGHPNIALKSERNNSSIKRKSMFNFSDSEEELNIQPSRKASNKSCLFDDEDNSSTAPQAEKNSVKKNNKDNQDFVNLNSPKLNESKNKKTKDNELLKDFNPELIEVTEIKTESSTPPVTGGWITSDNKASTKDCDSKAVKAQSIAVDVLDSNIDSPPHDSQYADLKPDIKQVTLEDNLPRNMCTIEFVSLLAKPIGSKQNKTKSKVAAVSTNGLKNFKKFKKTQHAGSGRLPTIIGGRDLEVYSGDRHQDIEELFRRGLEEEEHHQKAKKRADEMFNWDMETVQNQTKKKTKR